MTARLSIVIPVLNRARLVRQAIESVTSQHAAGVEIVVVDGGSNDGTRDVVSAIAGVQLLHAPGSSVYEALNIGVEAAHAPIIGHLNSDDRMAPAALERVMEAAGAHPDAEIVRGRVTFFALASDGGRLPNPSHTARVAHRLGLPGLLFGVPAINGCFISRRAYRRIGRYDETLRIAADREWLLRAVLAGVAVVEVDAPVYEYLSHPESMTMSGDRGIEAQYRREHLAIAERLLRQPQAHAVSRVLRAWHGHETARLLARSRPDRALARELAHAFRVSPGWPLHGALPLLRTLARRMAGPVKT